MQNRKVADTDLKKRINLFYHPLVGNLMSLAFLVSRSSSAMVAYPSKLVKYSYQKERLFEVKRSSLEVSYH